MGEQASLLWVKGLRAPPWEGALFHVPDDLIIAERESAFLLFGEDEHLVLPDIVGTPRGGDDGKFFHLIAKAVEDACNQTGCSGEVVSGYAVLDLDIHGGSFRFKVKYKLTLTNIEIRV